MSRSDVGVFWVEVKVGFELIDNGSAAPDIDAQKSQFGTVLHLASGDGQPVTPYIMGCVLVVSGA